MTDHRVENLAAAVELAESWRAAGTRSWFRGQNRLWPIATSLARRQGDAAEMDRFHRRLAQFCDWLEGTPELRHLLAEEHVHAFFAILQHHGVPTHYVDFTINPKVAGYFAGAGRDARPGEDGCILAIDPDEWVESLRNVATVRGWPRDAWAEKVIVHVPNLWRMEAQSGYFVYLPIESPESYVPVDRIVFPHDGSAFELTEEEIYPTRKSPLEERLDEFFTEELTRENQRYLREAFKAWSARASDRFGWVEFERPGSERWLVAGAGPHVSWSKVPREWLAYPHEEYRGERITVQLPLSRTDPLRQVDDLSAIVRRVLAETPGARRRLLDWRVAPVGDSIPAGWLEFVRRAAGRTWDGVRRLPYTDARVASAVAMTIVLATEDVSDSPSYSSRGFGSLLGPVLTMELANERDVTARAVMAEATFERALRPDLDDVIVPDLRRRPRQQLRQVLGPSQLFDFDRLVEAFALELVPTQVLVQSPDQAVFFSPARTPVIGAA